MIRRRDTERDLDNLDEVVYTPARTSTINYKFKPNNYQINPDMGIAGGSCDFEIKKVDIEKFLSLKGYSSSNVIISRISNDKYTWKCNIS